MFLFPAPYWNPYLVALFVLQSAKLQPLFQFLPFWPSVMSSPSCVNIKLRPGATHPLEQLLCWKPGGDFVDGVGASQFTVDVAVQVSSLQRDASNHKSLEEKGRTTDLKHWVEFLSRISDSCWYLDQDLAERLLRVSLELELRVRVRHVISKDMPAIVWSTLCRVSEGTWMSAPRASTTLQFCGPPWG